MYARIKKILKSLGVCLRETTLYTIWIYTIETWKLIEWFVVWNYIKMKRLKVLGRVRSYFYKIGNEVFEIYCFQIR